MDYRQFKAEDIKITIDATLKGDSADLFMTIKEEIDNLERLATEAGRYPEGIKDFSFMINNALYECGKIFATEAAILISNYGIFRRKEEIASQTISISMVVILERNLADLFISIKEVLNRFKDKVPDDEYSEAYAYIINEAFMESGRIFLQKINYLKHDTRRENRIRREEKESQSKGVTNV